ncbi:hypothetical protein C8J56DRAFT_1055032 [Mycena floridula]|nr:hypothetical protein C8J56DRAFT_1055032 [Mycena floridula]
MSTEKIYLPTAGAPTQVVAAKSSRSRFFKTFVVASCTLWLSFKLIPTVVELIQLHKAAFFQTNMPSSGKPSNDKIATDEFKDSAIDWLSGAVQDPSYDSMDPVGVDPRWEAFAPFHKYLLNAFPKVHETLKLAKIQHAAHQDVVPVDPQTVDEWAHPPYSGYFDGGFLVLWYSSTHTNPLGERIWGRGSNDDKSGLVGTLAALETLIIQDFKPARSIVVAFGFDEETSGLQGASELGKAMIEVYGEDSFALIIDEATVADAVAGGFTQKYGTVFAAPGIAEKGYLDSIGSCYPFDVRLEVASAGGHSSVPPSHTSIGILAALLVHYEKNPSPSTSAPLYEALQCYSEHGKTIPRKLRRAIKSSIKSKAALKEVEKTVRDDRLYTALLATTQAIDLVGGGVKTNALPETAWAVVNHRLSTLSSVDEAKEHDTKLLKHLAKNFNLSYTAFGTSISEEGVPAFGSLTISDAWGTALEPAPKSPTKGSEAAPFKLLSGTIKATYNAHRGLDGENIIVGLGGHSTGNTDTRYYWKLSRHIFRYNHKNSGEGSDADLKEDNGIGNGVHTVNESMSVDAFLEVIRFFTTLILNADESTSL